MSGISCGPNDVSTNLQHSPGRGAAFSMEVPAAAFGKYFIFFQIFVFWFAVFFGEGIKPALRRASVKKI